MTASATGSLAPASTAVYEGIVNRKVTLEIALLTYDSHHHFHDYRMTSALYSDGAM